MKVDQRWGLGAVLAIYMHITHACLPVRRVGDGRSTPTRDITPPTITCISEIHQIANSTSLSVYVWWDENSIVVEDDSNDAIIKTRTGLPPGDAFSEGTTTVTYHARDTSGNFASCSFNVTVEVIRCNHWENLTDGWKQCNLGYDMRLGTVCEFGCYAGHVLEGPAVRECMMSGDWDDSSQPFCQKHALDDGFLETDQYSGRKIQCPNLTPSGNQAGVVNITCTNENFFGSICTYSCIEGYDLLPGHNTQQLCTDTAVWHGDTPVCYDIFPPVFTNCPALVMGYAEPSMTSGPVTWDAPIATDNSGTSVSVAQTSGPVSGSVLEVGQYEVEYGTADSLDNTRSCRFTVFVKQIACPSLEDLQYTTAVCPEGRVLGSSCDISCEEGTQLVGQASVVCVQADTAVSQGVWDFDEQPYCEPVNVCPTLQVPKNGQLECDTWELGTVCHMTCNAGYFVPSDPGTDYDDVTIHHMVLVCGDAGSWTNDGNIPDCQEEDSREQLSLRIGLQYENFQDCSDIDDQALHESLLQTFRDAFQPVCEPPSCNISDIQANCGEGRRKRSEGTTFEFNVMLPTETTSGDIAYLRSGFINVTRSGLLMNEDLNITLSGEIQSPQNIYISQPDVVCTNVSGYDNRTAKCVKCNAGYFYDIADSLCSSCPQGYYQDMPGQTECIQCPTGRFTVAGGAYSASQCIEACAAGFYSDTGTMPCSACEAGAYTDAYSTTVCTPCPNSQTTTYPGSTSVDQCHDFDLVFTMPDSNLFTASIAVDLQGISTFTVSLWLRCTVCDTISTLKHGETSLMTLTNTNVLTVQVSSGMPRTSEEDLSAYSVWKKLTLIHTKEGVYIYVGAQAVLNTPLDSPVTENVHSPVSLVIGGSGFEGYVSQVQMWSSLRLPQSDDVTDTCIHDEDGDLINWAQFAWAEGPFVIAATSCQVSTNCSSSPCQNNGTCTDLANGFVCGCQQGYTGTHCESDTDNCDGNACTNGATCIDDVAGYTCVCSVEFTGELCELSIVNGGWTDWDISGACSVTCGVGIQQRSRVCGNPMPTNGGTWCEGSTEDYVECNTSTVCINECSENPTSVDYGDMNCEWTANDTRVCSPICHENYEFDNDIYLDTSAPVCGPQTGYTWNTRTETNPFAQIPSCTEKTMALITTMNYSATYDTLTFLHSSITADIKTVVDAKLQETDCIQNGPCMLEQTTVALAEQSTRRKRNSDGHVTFTATISCEPGNSLTECYDLLSDVISSMEDAIGQQGLTVTYNGVQYNVGVNSSTVDGTSLCIPGYVPVSYYCVPCGEGAYAYNNYCELCAHGTYQDEIGQTSCKLCTDGYTTEGLMTRDRELCNTLVPDENEEINWQIFTVATLCAVFGVLLIVAAIYIVWDRNFKTAPRTKDAYPDELDEPETPPVVRFNMRNTWYLGKPVKKEVPDTTEDEKDQYFESDSEIEFDVVEDLTWNDHDFQSVSLPETPVYGLRYSSPIMSKQHAWK